MTDDEIAENPEISAKVRKLRDLTAQLLVFIDAETPQSHARHMAKTRIEGGFVEAVNAIAQLRYLKDETHDA